MNKIKYGIKNVYYAICTLAPNGSATYATPKALPGAVSISLDQQGDTNKFYADNIVYYTSVANNGYEGDLEVAMLTDDFLKIGCSLILYARAGFLHRIVLFHNSSPPRRTPAFQVPAGIVICSVAHLFFGCLRHSRPSQLPLDKLISADLARQKPGFLPPVLRQECRKM